MNYTTLILKSGHRIKDFCDILRINTKQYYHYFKEGAYDEEYLRALFAEYDEAIAFISGKTPHKPEPLPISLKPRFTGYDNITWTAGLRTTEAKAKYFKVPELSVQEVEYYIINKKEIYISREDVVRIERGLKTLQALFVVR